MNDFVSKITNKVVHSFLATTVYLLITKWKINLPFMEISLKHSFSIAFLKMSLLQEIDAEVNIKNQFAPLIIFNEVWGFSSDREKWNLSQVFKKSIEHVR